MQKTGWILITVGILTVIVVSTVLIVKKTSNKPNKPDCPYCPGSTSKLGELCTKSVVHSYTKYAVSTDSNVCANAGKYVYYDESFIQQVMIFFLAFSFIEKFLMKMVMLLMPQ